MFKVTRRRLDNPPDHSKPYIVRVYDLAGNLVFWAGPMDIYERDKTIKTYRNYRPRAD